MFFFGLLVGLGAAWNIRYKYHHAIPIIVIGTPLVLAVIYEQNPDYLWFLDIRLLLKYDHRYILLLGRHLFIGVCIGIITYITLFLTSLFQIAKWLSKKNNF
jgi:hypothetical protein